MVARKGPIRPPASDGPFRAANEVGRAVITPAAQIANTMAIGIQLQDVNANNLAVFGHVDCYLSDNADGSTLTGTAPTTSILVGTDGLLIPLVAGKMFKLVAEPNGHADLVITSTAHTWYLTICLPTGTVVVSGPIAMV